MKKTKIICTMGPSTDDVGLLAQMMRSGMDLARFNFSHGSHDDHARRVELVRRAAAEVEKPIALIADTKGPEMRLGIFKAGKVILKEGDSFTLTTEEIEGKFPMLTMPACRRNYSRATPYCFRTVYLRWR